jgi:hypothetical protein
MEVILLGAFVFFAVVGVLAMGTIMSEAGSVGQITGPTRTPPRGRRFFATHLGEVMVAWTKGLGRPHLEHMELRLDLPAHLPRLQLRPCRNLTGGNSFEDRFAHGRSDDDSRFLLSDAVRERLLRLSKSHDTWQGLVSVELEGTPSGARLTILKEGHAMSPADVDRLREEIVGIAEGMLESWDAPWLALGERWPLGPIRRDGSGLRSLEGMVDGVQLQVTEIVAGGQVLTRFELSLPRTEGLRVVHLEQARGEGWEQQRQPTGNPVLDMLVAVRADGGEQARILLRDETLTDTLLPVVHGRRGELHEDGITLRIDGSPRDLRGPAGELVALGRALRERLDHGSRA